MSKKVLFQAIQFSISTQFSSIWPIDWTLSGAITPGLSESGSDGNKRVRHIPQSSSWLGKTQMWLYGKIWYHFPTVFIKSDFMNKGVILTITSSLFAGYSFFPTFKATCDFLKVLISLGKAWTHFLS